MSPLDEGFRQRTQQVFELWMTTYELALRRGQTSGVVRLSIDPRAAAFSLVAEIEGVLSLSRNSQDPRVLRHGLQNLRRQLEAMRSTPTPTAEERPMVDRPKMPAADPHTTARFKAALPDDARIIIRPMFGHTAAFINGNMFAGTFGADVFVRLDERGRAELLTIAGATPFAPMKGRVMAEYVRLPRSAEASVTSSWLARSFTWASTLPRKGERKSPRTRAPRSGARRK